MQFNTDFDQILLQAEALLSITRDPIANAANLSALIFNNIEALNWAGFYILREGELVLGPFQGQPACVLIPIGKGVCGTVAQTGKALRVEDVHAFDGHIACDAASESEIVVPIFDDQQQLIAVLDIDSPIKGRFSEADLSGFVKLADIYMQSTALAIL